MSTDPDQPPQFNAREAESFACEIQPERDAVRLRPIGALDIATVPMLQAQLVELRESGFRRLIIDLGGLDFLDSTGLRLLLEWDAEARRDGISIALVPGPPAVQRVFEVTGTLSLLPFVDG